MVVAPVVYQTYQAAPVVYAQPYYTRPYYSPYYAPVGVSLNYGYSRGYGGHHWR